MTQNWNDLIKSESQVKESARLSETTEPNETNKPNVPEGSFTIINALPLSLNKPTNPLVKCQCCEKLFPADQLKLIQTQHGALKACGDCYINFYNGRKVETMPEIEVIAESSGKKMSIDDLYIQASRNEQLKIEDLPWDTDPSGAQASLIARFEKLESIAFESKARAVAVSKKLRELDVKSGKNRWDKESKGQISGNLSDPKNNPFMKSAQAKHKAALTKVEKAVNGFMDLGNEENDIIDMLTTGGKFKGSEVREAIEKYKRGE